jgi:hypothetical protein
MALQGGRGGGATLSGAACEGKGPTQISENAASSQNVSPKVVQAKVEINKSRQD